MAVALLGLISMGIGTAMAMDQRSDKNRSCRSLITGSYLISIQEDDGDFASRAVITFHDDGTLAVADARESSGVDDVAFSGQLGSYRCRNRRNVIATTLDFGFPPTANIGRLDYQVKVSGKRDIAGEITLRLLTPVESCDPFDLSTCSLEFTGDFSFSGSRIPARLN